MRGGLIESLSTGGGGSILIAVMDGLGDLPGEPLGGRTPLEAAVTPNLDELARRSALGQHIPVSQGVTPGSGPAHLSIFGYDPVEHFVGRGILSALGIGFPILPGDLAARANFCTMDSSRMVTDRRAGRITTAKNAELCARLRSISIPGIEIFVEPEKEHRACVVFRGEGLSDAVSDTDPGHAGAGRLEPRALVPEAVRAAAAVSEFLAKSDELLSDEHPANGMLLRGFATMRPFPSVGSRFRIRAAAAAIYPMYRGVASLVGMEVLVCSDLRGQLEAVRAAKNGHDFVFFHFKPTDSSGEDGDYEAKVAALESFDSALPALASCGYDVICITGDHSTPCSMKLHSWHPVPVLLSGGPQRTGWSRRFTERECASGALGTFPGTDLMPLMLASAGRLEKYGA